MTDSYTIMIIVIAIEFVLVAAITAVAFIAVSTMKIQTLKRKKAIAQTTTLFKTCLENSGFRIKKFHQTYFDIRVFAFEQFLKKYAEHPNLDNAKNQLLKNILLPLAREHVSSRRWSYRFFAGKVFNYGGITVEDSKHILTLIKDPVPLVHIEAVTAGANNPTQAIIDAIIDQMSGMRRKSHAIYIHAFETSHANSLAFIHNRIQRDHDAFVRATCYKLLSLFDEPVTVSAINNDIESDNIELSIAAIHYKTDAEKDAVVPYFCQLLGKRAIQWPRKVALIQSLGELKAESAIHALEEALLHEAWWVRFNAALALKALGEPGINCLMQVTPQRDKFAYEAAQHVLQLTPSK